MERAGAVPNRKAICQAFGKTVRTLRKRAGIAQEELALLAGVDRGYMGSLERGEHTPTLETIYKLLPVLNLTLTEFAVEFERVLHALRR